MPARTSSTSTWAAPCARSARPGPAPPCSPTPTWRCGSRPPRERGPRAPGYGQAPLRAGPRRPRGIRPGAAAGGGGRRRGDRIPPALGCDPAQGKPRLRARPGTGRSHPGAADHLRRPRQRRGGAPRLRGLARGRGDDRARIARQPLDLRGADGRATHPAGTRGGDRGAALGDGPCRGAPRPRARRAIPAQVLPVVSRATRGAGPSIAAFQQSDDLDEARLSSSGSGLGRAGDAPGRRYRYKSIAMAER